MLRGVITLPVNSQHGMCNQMSQNMYLLNSKSNMKGMTKYVNYICLLNWTSLNIKGITKYVKLFLLLKSKSINKEK